MSIAQKSVAKSRKELTNPRAGATMRAGARAITTNPVMLHQLVQNEIEFRLSFSDFQAKKKKPVKLLQTFAVVTIGDKDDYL